MYGHPYEPYDVQKKFMTDLYNTLSTKKIGMYESPTGTGKTLSLLCPSLAWLRDSAKRQLELDLAKIEEAGGPAWLISNAKKMRLAQAEAEADAHHRLIEEAKRSASQSSKIAEPAPKKRRSQPASSSSVDQFLLETSKSEVDDVLQAFDELTSQQPTDLDPALEPLRTSSKIFFASRTHSQLAQVAEALKLIKVKEPVRFTALGSRRQLCIHPEVTSLSSVTQMNEKCADLQKNAACSYRHNTKPVKDQALGEIMDIEDLASYGKTHAGCPYYAARETLPYAEVVTLPYPMLLLERNRASIGVDLKNSVVIIDEAHNLIDSLTSLMSASVSASAVNRALQGLQIYVQRVGSRLSPSNRRKVLQVVRLVESLSTYFKELGQVKPGEAVDKSKLFSIGNVDTLNLLELHEFVHTSKLVFKVDSYLRHLEQEQEQEQGQKQKQVLQNQPGEGQPRSSSLGIVMDFMLIATDPTSDGKLFHDIAAEENNRLYLRYLVLDASSAFESVITDSKSVVLAGGTMEPMSEFSHYLFPQVDSKLVDMHSYDHIVPKSQVMVRPLSTLKLTFATRNDARVIAELGSLFIRIAKSVPNGVVAFFPGYKYLAYVLSKWSQAGVLGQIQEIKPVFAETSGKEDTFARYSVEARGNGALLLAVVGGRLSEGINFSDALARAVIMVGLPFPNAFSAEMVAKRKYIEQHALARNKSPAEATEEARQYYELLAMRAVNQSVGRAIRHVNDYAAILLIDERYKRPNIQAKLSRWVRDQVNSDTNGTLPPENELERDLRTFFAKNKTL